MTKQPEPSESNPPFSAEKGVFEPTKEELQLFRDITNFTNDIEECDEGECESCGLCETRRTTLIRRFAALQRIEGQLELIKKMKGHWETDDLDIFDMRFDSTIAELEAKKKEMSV